MNKADVAWIIISTVLVILMILPGLALFYGGLVRSKNVLSVLMQVLSTFALAVVLWFAYGYSLAFTDGNAFFGGFSKAFFSNMFDPSSGEFSMVGSVPEILFASFQATFAGISCALIVGSFVERARFSAVLIFTAIWMTFSYIPIAHMVWGPGGFLLERGALDFAGGTVVHINAGIAGLVGSYVIGKRIGFGKESMQPHNLPMSMIGASLLFVGWFGFNGGSALAANETAALAVFNTLIATAAAILAWSFTEWALKGKPSMLGGVSGAVAGLVGITPAAGLVGPIGAFVIGVLSGVVCVWGVNGLKRLLRADDSLDVFGIHGVAGIMGAILVGIFNAQTFDGPGLESFNMVWPQLWVQVEGVIITLVWSGAVAWIAFKIANTLCGIRVSEDVEREGLDINSHGESAYHN